VKRQPVNSRAVREAGYDPESRTLEIAFESGRVYQYLDVPESVFAWLLRARSKGAYVSRILAPYAYRDVTLPDAPVDLVEALEASLEPRESDVEGES